jgi:hypothetical protein
MMAWGKLFNFNPMMINLERRKEIIVQYKSSDFDNAHTYKRTLAC